MDRCVCAVDGWLCRIQVPRYKEVPFVTGYFSGHYQCYGLNVQAACDSDCTFVYFSVTCPGGSNDSFAYYNCKLHDLIENLPEGFWVAGDNAYVLTEKLLVPYSGKQRYEPSNSIFNFFLSQLRIRIEQSFGMLVNKWRIFKRPIECKLYKTTLIIHTAMRLHNFCIHERLDNIPDVHYPETYIPSYYEYLDIDLHHYSSSNPSNSSTKIRQKTRQSIRDMLYNKGVTRPISNIQRNKTILDID